MSVKNKKDLIGKEVLVKMGGLKVACQILDVRNSYGHLDCKVTPLEGTGEDWRRNLNLSERTQ